MAPASFPRAALAAALGWGLWAGLAGAQAPLQPPYPPQAAYHHPQQAPSQHQGAAQPSAPKPPPPFPKTHPGATELPPGVPPVDNRPSRRPLYDCLRYRRPLCCWASFNGYTCGSGKADCAFIFGSCRTFYGEPCLKGPPPSALPPWMGTPPDAGPKLDWKGRPLGPAKDTRGCNCPNP